VRDITECAATLNWQLVLLLSCTGLLLGALALVGVPGWIAWSIWAIAGAGCGVQIARSMAERLFLHGFASGAIAGFLSGLLQLMIRPLDAPMSPGSVGGVHAVESSGGRSILLVEAAELHSRWESSSASPLL